MIESGWKLSEKLPKLWFYKRERKSVVYINANGNIFATKDRALAHAAKENMQAEDLEKLKRFQPSKEDNIKQEVESPEDIGDASSDQDNSMEISVVGEQNSLNESVINDELFGDDFQDVEVMQIEKDEEGRPLEETQHAEETSIADQEEPVDLNKYLPQGWKHTKSKSNEGKRDKKRTWILSTEEGKSVGGIRSAYEYMGKNNYSDDDLYNIRMAMELDSWVADPVLPKNWLYKKRGNNNVYCSPYGKLMLSKDIAIEYLKKEICNPEDILKMQQFQPPPGKRVPARKRRSQESIIPHESEEQQLDGQQCYEDDSQQGGQPKSRRSESEKPGDDDSSNLNQEQTFEGQSEQNWDAGDISPQSDQLDSSAQSERSLNEDQFKAWKCDNDLYPSGWMFGGRSRNPNGVKLRAPEGTILVGVKSALHYMSSNGYPEADIAVMSRARNQNGWEEHEALPENWFYRRKGRAIEFCDPEGRHFSSKERALKSTSLVDDSDLVKFRKFQAPIHSMSEDAFVEDVSILPLGWKILKDYDTPNRNIRVISPQGMNFRTNRAALAHMIENRFANDDIEKLQKSIEQDGWFTHPNLPMFWRYKKPNSGLLFSDHTGQYFGSRDKALKSLRKFPEENMNEISLISMFQL